ncbi:PREDICTED: odorant receptor 94b-like, partial [Wasmannia auropunctata]|uniref:odorant receptor 94b-like n=1 Tax=Wasmannia auropunctata TaxID=64793 RepID=UPI0005EF0660
QYALWYYGLVQVTIVCQILTAIFMDFMKGKLTYKAWVPFDHTSPIMFFFVFTHQMIGMSTCASVNVACDSLIAGLLQEICCQFDLLENRLMKIFAVSMLVVCANLYKLASISILMINGSIGLIMYTACMLSQIFLYCWFGNELKLKSTELVNSIYKIGWLTFDIKTKRALLLIMKRTMVPIEFNSAIIIKLNLDSFVSLLKASYAVYNVLTSIQ